MPCKFNPMSRSVAVVRSTCRVLVLGSRSIDLAFVEGFVKGGEATDIFAGAHPFVNRRPQPPETLHPYPASTGISDLKHTPQGLQHPDPRTIPNSYL